MKNYIEAWIQWNRKEISDSSFKSYVGVLPREFFLRNKAKCLKAWKDFCNSERYKNDKITGSRCRYSKLGLSELQRKQRYGIIIGISRNGSSYRVMWNDIHSGQSYAKEFIEII